MKLKRLSLYFSFCFLAYSCGPLNNNSKNFNNRNLSNDKPSGPGCFAKCLLDDIYLIQSDTILEYTGTNYKNAFISNIEIELNAATSKWIKKKVDNNCRSRNPDDCLVWCLEKTDAVISNYWVVNDTTQVKSFKFTSIQIKTLIEERGYTDWREVLCANKQSSGIYEQVQKKLIKQGFTIENVKWGIFNENSKKALIAFQKTEQLAIGNFTFESLDALNVSY